MIVYPTGGGTGLVGMWKAFAEMEALGWIGPARPRMVAVQATGCAPIVRAFERGDAEAAPWDDARTAAAGLRVPRAIGDRLVLGALRESGGTAVAVSDEQMLAGGRGRGGRGGVLAGAEGGPGRAAAGVLAAFRAGIREVILPLENEKDLEDIQPELRANLEFIFVDDMVDVVRKALGADVVRTGAAGADESHRPAEVAGEVEVIGGGDDAP